MIKRIIAQIYYNILHKKKIKICPKAIVNLHCDFEGYNRIGANSHISTSKLGFASYIGFDCRIVNVEIGRYCSIGSNVLFTNGTHPTSEFVSSHPAFYSIKKQCGFTYVKNNLFEEYKSHDLYHTHVGNDVWIGDGAICLEGINIGDGAIIGAGAVVTKDVESYSIVGGIPAKHLKYRFEKEDRDFLVKYKWWERDPLWIKQHIDAFSKIQKLKEIERDSK